MSEREMTATALLDMHLTYGPGQNQRIDAEVWRRWPHLETIYGRHVAREQQFGEQRYADRGFDISLPLDPMPGQAEEYTAYLQQYVSAVEAIKDAQ